MKNKTITVAVTAIAASLSASAATISVDSVRQRWPWNNKVDVTYSISGADDTETKVCKVRLTTVVDGLAYVIYDPALNVGVKPGTYTVTWDGAPEGVDSNCTVQASFYTSPAVPSGDDYMIIDLKTGAVSYEGVFAATDRLCGVGGQELSNIRYNTDKYKSTHCLLRKVPKGTYKTGDSAAYPTGNNRNNDATWTTGKDYYIGVFPWTSYQYWYVFDLYETATDPKKIELKPRPLGFVKDVRGAAPGTVCGSYRTSNQYHVLPWLRAKTGLDIDLPTEVMYEIAARAGTTTKYFWGDEADDAAKYAVYGLSGDRPAGGWVETGTKLPNAWGIYDIVGNDWEWCLDTYSTNDDPGNRENADAFTPFIDESATNARVRGCNANGTAADMNPAKRAGAKFGTKDIYPFRVAYIKTGE